MDWEKIYENHTSDKLLYNIHTQIAQQQENNLMQGKVPGQPFLKKKKKKKSTPKYPMVYEKMINTIIIREMQIKTTMRCYLTPVIIDYYQKDKICKCWQGCREKDLYSLLVEM